MRYVLIALFAIWWMTGYVIPTAGFPRLILKRQARYDFIEYQKPAIEAVLYFNRECRQGREDPDSLIVYGFWSEDLRYFADYQFIGSIYGYADHYQFVDRARRGILTLHDWLQGYGVKYLVWDNSRMKYGVPYWGEFAIPSDNVAWRLYFEPVRVEWECQTLQIWRVK